MMETYQDKFVDGNDDFIHSVITLLSVSTVKWIHVHYRKVEKYERL